jgi:hypothetical protein
VQLNSVFIVFLFFPATTGASPTHVSAQASSSDQTKLQTMPSGWHAMATTNIKHRPQCTAKDDVISLYIYSDKLEHQLAAQSLLQEKIENHLTMKYGEQEVRHCECVEAMRRQGMKRGGEDGDGYKYMGGICNPWNWNWNTSKQ